MVVSQNYYARVHLGFLPLRLFVMLYTDCIQPMLIVTSTTAHPLAAARRPPAIKRAPPSTPLSPPAHPLAAVAAARRPPAIKRAPSSTPLGSVKN